MCELNSFFHNPVTGEVKVKDLNSHGNTEKELSLDLKYWREGHYLPNGKIVARVEPNDKKTEAECVERIGQSFPRFVDFFAWALKETNQLKDFKGHLSLNGLTSAKDLVLPKSVGDLSLNGLTSEERDGVVSQLVKN